MDVEKQNELRAFVKREVVYCVTELVSGLSSKPEYQEELLSVCSKPDADVEAFEHWVVSDWFARQLENRGEMVIYDFLGLTIWGRTCTGQAIFLDGIVEEIYNDHF